MPDWADGWAVGDWKRSRRVRVARAKGRQGVGSPWCPGGRACGRIVDASGDLDRFLGRWHGSIPLCAGWSGGANYRAFSRGNTQFCARNVQSGGFCRRPPVVRGRQTILLATRRTTVTDLRARAATKITPVCSSGGLPPAASRAPVQSVRSERCTASWGPASRSAGGVRGERARTRSRILVGD